MYRRRFVCLQGEHGGVWELFVNSGHEVGTGRVWEGNLGRRVGLPSYDENVKCGACAEGKASATFGVVKRGFKGEERV